MLFNSHIFIFIFLPVVIFVYGLLHKYKYNELMLAWLVLMSLVFYAWWDVVYLSLIIASIIINYAMGMLIARAGEDNKGKVLTFGVLLNLSVLAYYKYAFFLVSTVNAVFEYEYSINNIVLPLAISFFTFQQIAYLVDVRRSTVVEHDFMHYTLFVTFFPQLIAGPIVHHKEMMPQFVDKLKGVNYKDLSIGATIFIIGLFKKVLIADPISDFIDPLYASSNMATIDTITAWVMVLGFSFQIYFDFSSYSDMAVGIARMFSIRLPINFYSPYKANNIIEFWRRWHITLSRFLRDYLYIPMGGNRKGKVLKYRNLVITMLLGGLWHGASWNFVLWGGIHGVYLMINHAWHYIRNIVIPNYRSSVFGHAVSVVVTFVCVSIAWLFFRVTDMDLATNVLLKLVQFSNFELNAIMLHKKEIGILLGLVFFVWFFPNTYQIMRRYNPVVGLRGFMDSGGKGFVVWRPTRTWSLIISFMLMMSVIYMYNSTEFVYFQF